jgi:hypothetical protein
MSDARAHARLNDDWLFGRRTVQARAEVDLENTPDSFHAYAVPDGIDIRPGDVVQVHGVPSEIGFGEHVVMDCAATVSRAGMLLRAWTSLTALFLLTDLYEVGFEPKDARHV